MSAKMTAGPWHVNAVDTKRGRIVGDETAEPGTYDKLTINNHNATVAAVYRPRDARAIACLPELVKAARALLQRIDNITSAQFSKGAEREQRESLRRILARIDGGEQR